MTPAATPAASRARATSKAAPDGWSAPHYPGLLQDPAAIDLAPAKTRLSSLSHNIAHLHRRIENLEGIITALSEGGPLTSQLDDVIDLRIEAERFRKKAQNHPGSRLGKLTYRRLSALALAHGLAVSDGLMSGADFRTLTLRIATPPPAES